MSVVEALINFYQWINLNVDYVDPRTVEREKKGKKSSQDTESARCEPINFTK